LDLGVLTLSVSCRDKYLNESKHTLSYRNCSCSAVLMLLKSILTLIEATRPLTCFGRFLVNSSLNARIELKKSYPLAWVFLS